MFRKFLAAVAIVITAAIGLNVSPVRTHIESALAAASTGCTVPYIFKDYDPDTGVPQPIIAGQLNANFQSVSQCSFPQVPTNAALQALTPSASTPLIFRMGFNSQGDVPPLVYRHSSSPCSINAGNGDNGSQVRSLNNGCWIVPVPASGWDVRQFGAACNWNGTSGTDDSTPILGAINAAKVNGGGKVLLPASRCYSTATILVPPTVLLQGLVFLPDNPEPDGSGITCAASAATACVLLSGDGTTNGFGNGTAGLQNVKIAYAGTPPTGSNAVEVLGGSNVILDYVGIFNAYNGFGFVGTINGTDCTINPCYGISAAPSHIYTQKIANDHVYVLNWPELHVVQFRFGDPTAQNDLNSEAYVYITGGAGGGSQGPNGIFFGDGQFNQGVNAPRCMIEWANLGHPDSSAQQFKFHHNHFENSNNQSNQQGIFCTDAGGVSLLDRLEIDGNTFNSLTADVFHFDPNTQPAEWEIANNEFFCIGSNVLGLAPTPQIGEVQFLNNRLACPLHFTATAGNDTLQLIGNTYGGPITGGMTIDGSADWGQLIVSGVFTNGVLTNNTTDGSNISIQLPTSQLGANCGAGSPNPIGIAFGGATTGITYTTQSCNWKIWNNIVTVSFNIVLSNKGSATGDATLINLPKGATGQPWGTGSGTAPLAGNVIGLTGTPIVITQGGGKAANFYQIEGGGETPLLDTNFQNNSQIAGTIVYPWR